MRTYQELERLYDDESIGKFCKDAVKDFKSSKEYQDAKEGELYYKKHNTTIESYQKMLRTLSGIARPDVYSANYKLKTLIFRRLVIQQANYVLGNGLVLQKTSNKEKLGKNFDFLLTRCAKKAMASGVCFGFWNYDHMEIFSYADNDREAGFCPLYDEKTGELRAGIRFWSRRVGDEDILRMTLYVEDGYTEYRANDEGVAVLEPKRAYRIISRGTADGQIEEQVDSNYSKLPIVPMYSSDTHESELVGIREAVDCHDLIKSGFANNIDDASEMYWILKNAGAMDDIDLAQFIQRVRSNKAVTLEDGVEADAHTMEIPKEAREAMLKMLKEDIIDDFQGVDIKSLSAGAKTTQEIKSAYQSMEDKCADFEYYVIDFVQKILELAGINDNPTFVWNRVINQAEQTNMILSASNLLPAEMLIRHLPFLTPEEAEEAIKARESEDFTAFQENGQNEDDSEPQDDADEDAEDEEE